MFPTTSYWSNQVLIIVDIFSEDHFKSAIEIPFLSSHMKEIISILIETRHPYAINDSNKTIAVCSDSTIINIYWARNMTTIYIDPDIIGPLWLLDHLIRIHFQYYPHVTQLWARLFNCVKVKRLISLQNINASLVSWIIYPFTLWSLFILIITIFFIITFNLLKAIV